MNLKELNQRIKDVTSALDCAPSWEQRARCHTVLLELLEQRSTLEEQV